jgi:hypothetical protein
LFHRIGKITGQGRVKVEFDFHNLNPTSIRNPNDVVTQYSFLGRLASLTRLSFTDTAPEPP